MLYLNSFEYTSNFYNNFFEVDLIILRVFNIFDQTTTILFNFKIISQIFTEKNKCKSLLPKRDYLYVDDLSLATIKSTEYRVNTKFLILEWGKGSVKEIIDIIQRNLKLT